MVSSRNQKREVARKHSFNQTVFVKVHRAAAAIEKRADRALKVSTGLTFSQFLMLSALRDEKNSSQKDLAAVLGVTPAVVTRQADALIVRNIINVSPVNKRENSLSLTQQGEKLLRLAEKSMEDEVSGAPEFTTHEERVLSQMLLKLL